MVAIIKVIITAFKFILCFLSAYSSNVVNIGILKKGLIIGKKACENSN